MQKSSFSLILIITVLFVGLVVIQTLMFPGKIPDAAVDAELPAAKNDNEIGKVDPQESAPGNNDASRNMEGAAEPDLRETYPHQFLSIGRFDPEAGSMVVQFDTLGATIRRIELNTRRSNGDFLYRDVDSHSAWIGQLELTAVDGGCRVQLIVPGSPADQAGILLNETIEKVKGEPVISSDDFAALLSRIDSGDDVELTVKSTAGVSRDVSVQSMRSPMEVIRPTPDELLTETMKQRRSFQFSLKQKVMGEWPDIDKGMGTANWKAHKSDDPATESIDFTYDLPKLADGSQFQVIKRYSLPADPGDFHVNMELEIRNLGLAKSSVNFELWGPTGLPIEGWWYQQKIHGDTWAFTKMAGARDVTVSTVGRPFHFFSCPDIVANSQKAAGNEGISIIGSDLTADERLIKHLAVDTQYFTVALRPDSGPFECYSAFATTASIADKENTYRARKTTDVNFVIFSNSIEVDPFNAETQSGAWKTGFQIFAGPKDPKILSKYDLDSARTFGWFGAFSKPLIGLLHLLYKATFSTSYGLAIIMLTLIVRSLMIPVSRKAALNAQMMQHLSPQIKQFSEKYKDQPEKRIKAQQELFAKYRYNPFGGCLLMLLQMPIFLGLYRGLSVDVELRDAPLVSGLTWCSNLAGPDQLFNWSSWMPTWFGAESGWLGPWFNVLPILSIGLMLAQQKLFMPPATDDQSRMAQSMMKYMMIFMAFVFFKVASGLCVYFITSSIWGIIERKMLPKPELNIEKIEARASGARPATGFMGKRKTEEPKEFGLSNDQALEQRKQLGKERKRKMRDR